MIDSPPTSADNNPNSARAVALIPAGIALNLGLGMIPYLLKVPFLYLDAVGTIVCTLVAGWRVGLAVGVGSFLIGGIWNPALPWFIGTQACIAGYVHFVAMRGGFRAQSVNARWRRLRVVGWLRPVLAGIGLGIVAGIISAPVITLVFGGITGSGPSVVVAFLLRTGETLLRSVVLSGLAAEPVDKTVQVLVALTVIRALPSSLKAAFGGGLLRRNGLLSDAP